MGKFLIVICLSIFLVGCEGVRESRETTGLLIGAGAGALVGSQFGQGTGRVVGATVGAVGGALLGREIAKRTDENTTTRYKSRRDTSDQYYGY